MICYAVIDTNVLISALLSNHEDAATVQVLKVMFAGDIVPVYSDEILAEYNEVLRREKFHFSESLIMGLVETITKFGVSITPAVTGEIIPDMKDLPFYEVVMEIPREFQTGRIPMANNKRILAYLLRVGENGQQYQGCFAEVENSLKTEQRFVDGLVAVVHDAITRGVVTARERQHCD